MFRTRVSNFLLAGLSSRDEVAVGGSPMRVPVNVVVPRVVLVGECQKAIYCCTNSEFLFLSFCSLSFPRQFTYWMLWVLPFILDTVGLLYFLSTKHHITQQYFGYS